MCAAACASLAMQMPLNVSPRAEDLSQVQRHLLELLQQPELPVPFTPSLKVLQFLYHAAHSDASRPPPFVVLRPACALSLCTARPLSAAGRESCLPHTRRCSYLMLIIASPARRSPHSLCEVHSVCLYKPHHAQKYPVIAGSKAIPPAHAEGCTLHSRGNPHWFGDLRLLQVSCEGFTC